DDLVEFGDLSPIGSGQLVFGHFNGLFKVPQFEVQICLVIGKFLVEQLGIGDLIKTGAGLVVVILFIGNVPQVVFGLGTIFFGVGHLIQKGFGLGGPFGGIQGISVVEVETVPFGKGHGGIVHFFVPLQGQGVFAGFKIIIGHVQKGGIPFGGGGITLHKVLHQFIGPPLVQPYGRIGGKIGRIGLGLPVAGLFPDPLKNILGRLVLSVVVQGQGILVVFVIVGVYFGFLCG